MELSRFDVNDTIQEQKKVGQNDLSRSQVCFN